MAIVGAMSSVAIVSFMEVAGGMAKVQLYRQARNHAVPHQRLWLHGDPSLLLAPFTRWGAGIVLLLEVILLATYFVGRRPPVTDPGAH